MCLFWTCLWNSDVCQVNRGDEDGGSLCEEGPDSARCSSGPPEALSEGGQLPALLEQSHHRGDVPGAVRTHSVSLFFMEGKRIDHLIPCDSVFLRTFSEVIIVFTCLLASYY